MIVKLMGMPFYITFFAEPGKEFNELTNFAKTHNLYLKDDGEPDYYTIDEDKEPKKQDITRFLKVLKESGDWEAITYPGDRISPDFLVISHVDETIPKTLN